MLVWILTFLDDLRSRKLKRLAGIEYGGIAGISAHCLDAVRRLLQFGEKVTEARILTSRGSHCLLLSYDYGRQIAIKSGFSSGYLGEGPRTFAEALLLLGDHGVEIDEYLVSDDLLERIDYSALTQKDIEFVMSAHAMRPQRFHDYIYPFRRIFNQEKSFSSWSRFPSVIPFALIDSRIRDLAMKFEADPDSCLLVGYRRLEDVVRRRTGLTEHGSKLFSQVFVGPKALLVWKQADQAVRNGRGGLFTAAYMAFRNPRAHLEHVDDHKSALAEFLLLNHLFLLEGEALAPLEATQKEVTELAEQQYLKQLMQELNRSDGRVE